MDNTWFMFTCLNLHVFYTAVKSATPSVAGCPPYVEEGGTLTCTCTKGDCTSSDVTLSWRDRDAGSPTLVQTDVQRQDNGSPFTCQMVCGGETSTVTYTLQVGYGPSADNITILGNTTLIADGTNVLNLTCLATDVYPKPRYTWLDSLCRDNYRGSTCSFRPQSHNDGETVRCRASDTFRDIPVSVVKGVTLDLQYPPAQAPEIHAYNPGQLVKNGDILTCTVTGGKPRVASVIFQCESPVHQDGKNTTRHKSVSSFIVVDTTNSTGEDIVCNCTAEWAPQMELYTLKTDAVFSTTYPAVVETFTVNGTSSKEILIESETSDTEITCQASGIPHPNLTLSRQTGDRLEMIQGHETNDYPVHRVHIYITLNFTCHEMGNYTCFADNGLQPKNRNSIQINVPCAPQPAEQGFPNSKVEPPELTTEGLSFELMAYPVPDSIHYFKLEPPGNGTGSISPPGMFLGNIKQKYRTSPLVVCAIQPISVTEQQLGLYYAEVSNRRGTIQYFFEMKHPVDTAVPSNGTAVAAIVGWVIAGVVLAAVVVALAVFLWNKKHRRDSGQELTMDSCSSRDSNASPGNQAPSTTSLFGIRTGRKFSK